MTGIRTDQQLKVGDVIKNYTLVEKLALSQTDEDNRRKWKVKCSCGVNFILINRTIRRSKGYCSKKCSNYEGVKNGI